MITEVRAYLTAHTGTDPITALPTTRTPGQWPGKSGFNEIMALLYIITILAFLSSLFLISATMNTLIAEQAGEIAILKTLGGRRRQIGGIALPAGHPADHARRGARAHAARHPRAATARHPDPARHGPPVPVTCAVSVS